MNARRSITIHCICRSELRDEHRRLRRQPVPARRLVHRPRQRVPLRVRAAALRTELREHARPLHAQPVSYLFGYSVKYLA